MKMGADAILVINVQDATMKRREGRHGMAGKSGLKICKPEGTNHSSEELPCPLGGAAGKDLETTTARPRLCCHWPKCRFHTP